MLTRRFVEFYLVATSVSCIVTAVKKQEDIVRVVRVRKDFASS